MYITELVAISMRVLFIILVLFIFFFSSCSNQSNKVKIHEVTLVELPEKRAFINFWKGFSTKFNSLDTATIRVMTLDSIWLWGDKIPSTEFLRRYHDGYSISDFIGILDTNKVMYSSIGCDPSPHIKEAIRQQYSKAFNCDQVLLVQDTAGSIVNGIEFSFLQTTKGYRLFGIKYSSRY